MKGRHGKLPTLSSCINLQDRLHLPPSPSSFHETRKDPFGGGFDSRHLHACGGSEFHAPATPDRAPLAGSVAGDDSARFDASLVTRGPVQVPNIAKAVATPKDGSLAIARQDALTRGMRVSPSRSLDSVVDLTVLREPSPYRRFFVASDGTSAEFAGHLQAALAEVSAIDRPGGITASDAADCPSIALAVEKRIGMEPSLLLETVETGIRSNPDCACEFVKSAIESVDADSALPALRTNQPQVPTCGSFLSIIGIGIHPPNDTIMLSDLITEVPGPRSLALAARLRRSECHNTTFISPDWPVFWERADGVNIWDVDGNRFIDLTSAFGVATLGHGATAEALRVQSCSLLHAMGDVHPARLKVELCEALGHLTFGRWIGRPGKCLLGNSGFEAVESALKTAVLATGKSGVAAFHGAYHGLGYGALLGAGIPWFREPFSRQLADLTTLLPYPREHDAPSIEAFRSALTALNPATTAAILVEPYQGRGGIVVPHPEFLSELRSWCDQHNSLLILDEIYTGFLRTGPMFACEETAVVPDLICLGKALTGGFPLSACVGRPEIMDAWPVSNGEALHTSTFLGNPLGCAMAIESLNVLSRPETRARAVATAGRLNTALSSLREIPIVHEIRGPGLMKGIELRHPDGRPAGDVVISLATRLLKQGIILLPDAPDASVIALTPPIPLSSEEIDFSIRSIASALAALA